MTSRKEIVELVQDLPMDDTWLPAFLERLKENHPSLYAELTEQRIDPTTVYKSVGAPQPVAWTTDLEFDSDTEVIPAKHKGKLGTRTADIALYTAAPKRPWVGLTDEQINQYDYEYRDLLYDAEKMLRENNA